MISQLLTPMGQESNFIYSNTTASTTFHNKKARFTKAEEGQEAYPGPSSSQSAAAIAGDGEPMRLVPQPMEGLHDNGPPPFLTKTYDMVDDPATGHIVAWSRGGKSFVVWDPSGFSTNLLPRYFKHNNFSSFVRQLNTYGFRKIDPDGWEFAAEGFTRGHRHLLKNLKRRKATSNPLLQQEAVVPCVEVGAYGLEGEVNRFKRDRQVLMTELLKLRQHQQNTRAYIQAMDEKLQGMEYKQQKMMKFLAKAMRNPLFIQELVRRKARLEEVGDAMGKKRDRPVHRQQLICGGEGGESSRSAARYNYNHVKSEPLEFGDSRYGVSELEALALEMQGFGRGKREQEQEQEQDQDQEQEQEQEQEGRPVNFESLYDEFDEGFWDELFDECFTGEPDMNNVSTSESDQDEVVGVLTHQLGYLGSSPK